MTVKPEANRLFIADLHLSADRPGTLQLFLAFLSGPAREVDELYILGDLFDAWIGDDDDSSIANRVREALSELSNTTRVYLQHGNRDFLLGDQFVQQTGCHLIDEETLISSGGISILLMHGDLLCTDDKDYQQARLMLRNPAFIADFLSKSLTERSALAAEYRKRSGEATSLKADDIMDVNEETVRSYMEKNRATHLLHGHTHRPGNHRLQVTLDGQVADAQRHVLGEWHEDRGNYFSLSNGQLETLEFTG